MIPSGIPLLKILRKGNLNGHLPTGDRSLEFANSNGDTQSFGVFPLKYFSPEGIATDSGRDVSNREVKSYAAMVK